MFALVDCNSFFVSAERLFRPDLQYRPVCVLSNNDGCVVSLSDEAKKLGIVRGDPLFKIKHIIQKEKVAIFSSNYLLYAGISARVMQILSENIEDIDIYSIDEAFLYLGNDNPKKLEEKMRKVSQQIKKWVGIPTSIGIASTKTLAKVAADYAKKHAGYKGVCLIDNEIKREKALAKYNIGEVWGIGRQYSKKMAQFAIQTAYDFTQQPENWVRKHFTIMGVRTWKELKGFSSIDRSEIIEKKSICTSRSFGSTVKNIENLKESVANFTASCGDKLRRQKSAAKIVTLFLRTDRFAVNVSQYANCQSIELPVPTSDSAELIYYAFQLLEMMFKEGYAYKKAGVILSGIVPQNAIQQNMFDTVPNRQERKKLNTIIDKINHKNGLDKVKYAVQDGKDKKWIARKEHISKNYLTDINDLMEVH